MKRGSAMRADLSAPGGKLEINIAPKRRSGRKSSVPKTEMELSSKPRTKIYVYLQLKRVENVPKEKGPIEVELTFGGETIPRLDCECTKEARMDLRDANNTATFSFPIIQDSIDDLNIASDHPIIITLLERIVSSSAGEEYEVEYRRVYAQGYIDILGYFTKKRFSTVIQTFVYPTDKEDHIEFGTVKAVWHIYALLPLLKEIDFSNLIFINFESLYNVNEDLMDDPEDLMGVLSFRSLLPNEHGRFETNKICSFSGFSRTIIKEQNPYLTWEAAKSNEHYTGRNFGLQSDSKVNIYSLFQRVLRPEGVELSFRDIILEADEALTCNSMHRFVLTDELRALLEDVFVFRQQQLLVQLYRLGAPDDILMEGIIEPSILLYPFVNAVRFAVVLSPPPKSDLDKSKRKLKVKDSHASGDSIAKPMFGIVSMCLLTPISETAKTLANYTQSTLRDNLKFCRRIKSKVIMAPFPVLIERAYDNFDEWITDLVDYIVKNKIHDVADARNFFCCQAENGSNKILKLIALDFNQRTPTKDNIEFCNLLTTVYKELVERANSYIKNCGPIDLSRCRKSEPMNQNYIKMIMNFIKFNYETGNEAFGDMLFNKLKKRFPQNADLNFYTFLHNVEMGNFTEAKKYCELTPKDRHIQEEILVHILEIYIEYMETLPVEETFNQAYEQLLQKMREFLKYFYKDIASWMLLYCLYKKSGYMPGMEFARWHYEDLYSQNPHKILENVPINRFSIYYDNEIPFRSTKAIQFYESVKFFQSIGAYKFAQFLFDEIAAECTDVDRFLQTSTLKIFLHELDPQSGPRSFASASAGPSKLFLDFVNGNIEYARGNKAAAADYYQNLTTIPNDSDFSINPFELGIRRHAAEMLENNRLEEANFSFSKCCNLNNSCMISSISMGQILYKLGRYEEALESFKYATQQKIHIPDVWAYLALINLKLGKNFNALECWKYAKLNPENVIAAEIIEELRKVNVNDVDLYVDKPV